MELTPKGRQTVKVFRNLGIFLVVLAAAYFGIRYFGKSSKDGKLTLSSTSKPDLVVAYNTFTGVEGLVLENGGMEPNENSEFYKKYGLKVLIKQMDAVKDTIACLH